MRILIYDDNSMNDYDFEYSLNSIITRFGYVEIFITSPLFIISDRIIRFCKRNNIMVRTDSVFNIFPDLVISFGYEEIHIRAINENPYVQHIAIWP